MGNTRTRPARVTLCLILSLFLVLAFVTMGTKIPAQAASSGTISSIQVNADLAENGTAEMTETWTVDVPDDWTEMYLVKDNLDDMAVSNLQVTDTTTGTVYKNIGDWDVDASRSQKAGKCGINDPGDGSKELCWGVGSSGAHTYRATYTMTNVVKSYSDGYDGFNIRFINSGLSSTPEKVSVTVKSDTVSFTTDDTKVWAFGLEGQVNVQDGAIVLTSDDGGSIQYANILARFNSGMFQPAVSTGTSFADLKDKAMEGSDYNSDETTDEDSGTGWGTIIFFILFVMLFFVLAKKKTGNKDLMDTSFLTHSLRKDPPYYRDIPFKGDLSESYTALSSMGEEDKDGNVMSAFLLKWMKNGCIRADKTDAKKLFGSGTESSIVFLSEAVPDTFSPAEQKLWSLLNRAAGGDGILQEKELYKWSKKNYESIQSWYDEVVREGMEHARTDGTIAAPASPESENGKHAKKQKASNKLSPDGEKSCLALLGLRHYLKDFTIINERQARDVALWGDYLVYASLFGMADEVAKEFKKILPDYFTNPTQYGGYSNVGSFDAFDMLIMMSIINNVSNAAHSGYVQGHTAAERAQASSGGGGFTSFGGGGGFSGGGMGGGGR